MAKLNTRVTGIDGTISYLNETGRNVQNQFKSTILNDMKALSRKMQIEMNSAIEGGVVPFTGNAMTVLYKMRDTGITCTLLVKDIQANYLYDVIVKPDSVEKFIPTSASKLTKQGNITGLRNNIKSGRYKIVESHGVKRIINTKATHDKRVIARKEDKTRKIVYDWYQHANDGIDIIIGEIKGSYTIRNSK